MLIQPRKAILRIVLTGSIFLLVITSECKSLNPPLLSQPNIRQKEADPSTARLIPLLLDNDLETRDTAFKSLKELGANVAVPALIQALQDKDWRVQAIAAYTLGRFGSEARTAIPALSQAIKVDNADIRFVAVQALGEIGSEAVVPALIEALQDKDENVRVSAVEALNKIGTAAKPAVPLLTKVFWDGNWFVRSKSAKIIASLGLDNIDHSILIEPWKNSNNLRLTEDSLVSLMLAINPSFLEQPEQLPLFFVQSLQKTDNITFLSASTALQNLSSSNLGLSYKDVVLQRLLQEFPLEKTIQNLKNSDVKMRRKSVEILVNILLWSDVHDKPNNQLIRKASLALMSVLEDPDPEIRKAAIKSLRNIYFIDNSMTIAILESSIKNKDVTVRQIATSDLTFINFVTTDTASELKYTKAIVSILIQAIQDSDPIVRQNAVKAFASKLNDFTFAQKQVFSALFNAIYDTEERTRQFAIKALNQPVPILLKLIQSNNEIEVRRTAILQLWQIILDVNPINIDEKLNLVVFETLDKALEDKDLGIRQNAAIALLAMDKITIESAFDVINQGLRSEDPLIQMDAVTGLGLILFSDEPFSEIKVERDLSMIRSYTQKSLPLLLNLLKSDVTPLRYSTDILLTTNLNIENEDMLVVLQQIIDSETDYSISLNASSAIGRLSPEKAMSLLVKSRRFQEDQEKEYDTNCPISFTRIYNFDSAKSYAFLIRALKNSNARFSVVQAISDALSSENISTERFIDTFIVPLISILENKEIQNSALSDALQSKDKDIRRSAAFLLGEIASSDTISQKKPELKQQIKSSLFKVMENQQEDIDVRWIAASSLQILNEDIEWFYQKNNLINPQKLEDPMQKFKGVTRFSLQFNRYYVRNLYHGSPGCGDGLYEIYSELRRRLSRKNTAKK